MSKIEGYIPKDKRKNILLLADDLRLHSGIATMSRAIVEGTAHRFNWIQLGAALKHHEEGKRFDLSEDIGKRLGIEDPFVMVQPNSGYGDAIKVRNLIREFNIDAVMIFTDPRYWTWLFDIEREIRSTVPIVYYNIWDDYPSPFYNRSFYDSVDVLLGISKQTVNINKLVLGDRAKNKVIKYVPHGINKFHFYPVYKKEELDVKEATEAQMGVSDYEFIAFFNSRNIARKHASDLIFAWRQFCDKIGEEKAKKTCLIMHTAPFDQNGTNLEAVREAFCVQGINNVFFSTDKLNTPQMNMLYNIADVTILPSSNEGWGLSLTESMMAGTMIIANTTGGMQDQMRFVDEKGKWIEFDDKFPSNHRGTYKECGEWAVPVFPSNISVQGSQPTPYIFDDRCSPEDIAIAIEKVYNMSPEERKERGGKGREFACSEESRFTAAGMSKGIIEGIEQGIDSFTPRPKFDLIKIEDLEPDFVKHKIYGY